MIRSICLIVLIFSFCSFNLHAQGNNERNLDKLNKERVKAEEDIQHISDLIKSLEGQQKNGVQSLTLLQKKIESRRDMLKTIDKQIDELKVIVDNKQVAIEMLQADLKQLQNSYAQLLVQYYSYRNKSNWLMYIMASESVSQAYRRIKYLREILNILKIKANQIAETTNKLNNEIITMADKQKMLNSNLGDKQKEVQTLEKEENLSKNVLSSLQSQKKDMVKQLADRKREYEQFDNEIKKHIKAELSKSLEEGISDETLLAAKDFEEVKGILPWPTVGVVTAHFGPGRPHPAHKDLMLPDNNGVDIQAAPNADVYSVFNGKVSKIFKTPGQGLSMIISHGPYLTVYNKLSSVSVKSGDVVKANQKIGKILNSNDGSILHFQIWKNMTSLDPEVWLLK